MIADTSFLIDLMKKKPNALKKLEAIEKRKDSQITTTPTLFELVVGIKMCNFPEKEKEKVLKILGDFSILSLGIKESWQGGEILGITPPQRISNP